jgi:putative polyhydroxyalkanoate system protein
MLCSQLVKGNHMADIHIQRAHSMPLKKAREAANDFARRLEEKFELDHEWNGDTLSFSRSGVSGTLALTKSSVTIDVKLGFLLSAFAGKMEGHIKDNLDQLFGAAGPAAKTAAAAAKKKKP